MRREQINWTEFKALVVPKFLEIQYHVIVLGSETLYEIWAGEKNTEYSTRIVIDVAPSGDQLDFETNYKATANDIAVFNVASASGTYPIPVYFDQDITNLDFDIRSLDASGDSVSIYSSSGTPEIPIYAEDPIPVSITGGAPLESTYDTILAVPRLVETTIVDYTVPIGRELAFTAGRATGDTDAEFYLQIDGANKDSFRTSWCERTANFDFSQGSLTVSGGSVVRIRVYHEENTSKHGSVDFWGSIAGTLS